MNHNSLIREADSALIEREDIEPRERGFMAS